MALLNNREIKNVQIDLIRPNTYQPRKVFNQESLEELTESIKTYGVLQPISIRMNGNKYYELIAGERRLRAAKMAGLNEIPAIIVEVGDNDSAVLALIENLQRENLNFLEEAEGYENLIKDHKYTQEQLSYIIGKKQSTIANKLRILRLSDNVKSKLLEYNLTERHARSLLKLPEEELQLKVLESVNKKMLNVKKTEDIVEEELKKIESKQTDNISNKTKKIKMAIMNAKIYINTIKNAMVKNGVEAQYSYKDEKEYLEITVKIPKKM